MVVNNQEPHKHQDDNLADLQKERDLLHAMVSDLPSCHIFLKDRESRFILTNNFQLKLLGVETLQDVIGKTDFDFFPRELAEQYYRDEQEIIRTGKPLVDREERAVYSHGETYWLLTSKTPLYSREGKIIGIVGLSRDITPRKKLEEEREKLIAELQAALAKINTLSGLLPICPACKKVRDDDGYWQQVETYIKDHSGVKFTHGYCPDCARKWIDESGVTGENR
jgi:PAS domain S-box-containing protein